MGWSPSLTTVLLLAFLATQSHSVNARHVEQCYGSVGGANGHIYQFDGGHVTTFSRGCQFLLARSHLKLCHLELYASFGCSKSKHKHHKKHRHGLSRLKALVVKLDGKEFKLLKGRRLLVNGKSVNVPYSEHKIRAFYSGEDLVLVSNKCGFWVTFDGEFTATFRLSSNLYRGRVSGLAGNCDGNKANDNFGNLSHAYKLWKSKGWVKNCKGRPKKCGCHTKKERREAERACRKVIGRHGCSNTEVLRPCVIDYCSTRYRPDLQRKVLCANFYLHSRRCARNHRPIAWRHKSGCVLSCGRHQHFSRKANPCPKTCDNHFFGTPRRCYKLPKAEGCRCNKGYVLDGTKCVKPKHCECLAKLCIDRVSHHKCRHWKAQGRCRRYPEVMGRFCRLTCGMCTPHCRNQISTLLCEQIKKKGKCSKQFYRVMCQATCQPNKCRCSAKRRIVSKCSDKYKNKAVTTLRWFPDSRGRCRKSILIRYHPCGACPYISKVRWYNCNYCKGVQIGKRLLQYREKHGKKRCVRVLLLIKRKCPCPPIGKKKSISYTECRNNVVTVRITKTYKPTRRCSRCERKTSTKVVRKINCTGFFHTGKCTPGRKYYFRITYKRYAHKCRCRSRKVSRKKIMCRCSKPKSVSVCKGSYYLIVTTHWKLKNGRCVPHQTKRTRKIRCDRNQQNFVRCHRSSCKAFRHISYFHVRNCKCLKYSKVKHIGKCCCPRSSRVVARINQYWKKIVTVTYTLIKYRCIKKIIIRKIRIKCPKGGVIVSCDGRKGQRIFTKFWYEKKGNNCIKRTLTKKVTVKCRRDVKRLAGPCRLLSGNVRYRRVEFRYYKRRSGSCSCVPAKRVAREMCGCRGGKHTRVTKCPKGCTTKNCGRQCTFSKLFYFYKAFGKRCREHIFKRLHFRCCCRPNRRVKNWCRKNQYQMRQISYYQLKAYRCRKVYKTSSKRVRCNRKPETKRIPHPKKGYYYLATYSWYVSKCKCRVRITKRVCRTHCRSKKIIRFCDKVRREKVTRHIIWRLQGCNKCISKVHDRRVPVRCSKTVKKWKHCNKRTGIVTHYRQWWYRKDCQCLKRTTTKKLRCGCPKPITGRSYCNPKRNAFEKKITFWILSKGRCLKRSRIERKKVKCSSKIQKRSECKPKSGVKVIYIGVMRPKNCKCRLVWSVHNKRQRCNCHRENKQAGRLTVHFCDKRKNRKGTEKFHFVLVRGRCVKRSKKTYRNFRCPRAYYEKRNCNEARRLQLVLRYYSVKRNCKCVKLVQRKHVKCGCSGKKVELKRYCKKVQGEIIKVRITRRWSNRRHVCVTKKKTTSHRVLCRSKKRYVNSKCIKNKYYIETTIYHERKGCKCIEKRLKRKRNCHCKRIIRRGKCPRHGYTRREVVEVRVWDMKHRRCRTKRQFTRQIRCRCPKGYKRRYCEAGKWVTKSVRFILKNTRCYKKVSKSSRKVHCRREIRHRYASCQSCHRYIYTLERRLDPKRCACYFSAIERRRCPCCCPKGSNTRRCIKDDEWERVFTHNAPLTGRRCGCRTWKTRRREKVSCSTRKTYKWLKCNRRSCHSHQQVTYYKAKRCRCEKRQRLTGRKRVCCCLTKPRFSKFCKNSSVYEKKIYYQLHNWRCRRRVRNRFLHRWSCKQKPVIKVGRCNKGNCYQSVHTLISVVDKPRCRCKNVVRNRHRRRCCCIKKPHKNTKCLKNCWVTTYTSYKFDGRRRVCVAKINRRTNCVTCPRTSPVVGKCNKKTCRRRITFFTYSIDKCKCKRRTYYRYKTCCCPKPSVSGPVCKKNRYRVWYYKTWKLVHGQCVSKVKESIRTVKCRRGVIRVLRCNKATCRQVVRREVVSLKRCRCLSSWRVTQRTCCCRPAHIINTRCERNRYLYRYKTTRRLNRKRVCVSRTTKRLLYEVSNCRTTEKRGACNKRTRYSTVYITHRKIHKCKCIVYRRSTRRVLCRCKGSSEKRGKCSKTTCKMAIVKTWFTSHGKLDNFKCKRHQRVFYLRCCCHPRPTYKLFCNKRTGSTMKRLTRTVFVASSRTCIRRHSTVVVKKLVCPKNYCRSSKCNKKTGYKVRYCYHFTKVRSLCRCNKRITQKKIICSCQQSKRVSFCQGHTKKISVITYWKLSTRENRCIRMVKRVTNHLVCPKNHWVKRSCKGCQGVKHIHHYLMRRCHCLRKTRSYRIRCCCPKSHHKKRCLGNKWLFEQVKYKLRHGVCKKTVCKKQVPVACPKKKTKRGQCKGCVRKHYTWYYHVRGCKCLLKKRKVRKSLCCCPKPRKYVQCKGGVKQKVCESWSLCSGSCLKKRHVTSSKVICPCSTIKRFACNMKSLKQKAEVTSYSLQGCKCVKKLQVKYVHCKCRPSTKKFEKCDKKPKRRVFRIVFQLYHQNGKVVCKPKRYLLYWEPCRCKASQRTRTCASNGRVFVTAIKKWNLCKRHGRRECVLKTSLLQEAVECQGKSVKWSNCKNFRTTRTVIRQKPVLCHCKSFVKKKVFACNCNKKSYKKRVCHHKTGIIAVIHKSFHSCCGATSCSSKSQTSYYPVKCSKRKRVSRLSRKCGIMHHHGWYTKYLLTWKVRQGCKCVSKQKKVMKLCRCKKNSSSTKCSRSGRYFVTVRYTYKRKGSTCHLTRTEQRRPVKCKGKKVQIKFYGCSKCRRRVSLSQCYVHSCRIHHYRKSGLQRCCTPKPKTRHYCDARKGRRVWETTTYSLVPSKPLLKDRDGRVRVPQLKVVSKKSYRYVNIRCPRGEKKEHCDRRTGLWRKVVTTWHIVGCKCVKKLKRYSGRCRCQPPKVRWGKCRNRYTVKTVIYFTLKNRECIRQVRRHRYLCACLKDRKFTVCDGRGRWKTCQISYQLQRQKQRCLKLKQCRSRPHTCSSPREKRGPCIRCRRIITRYVWHLNKKKCKCERRVQTRRADCDCHKKNSSRTECKRGAFITTIYRYKLTGERCVRSVSKVAKPVDCDGRRRSRIIRGSCVTARGSSHRGYQKLITEWKVNKKCKCVRQHIVRWVPCVCKLISKYRTRRFSKCIRGSTVRHTTVFYKLVGYKCIKKVQTRHKKIKCSRSKTVTGKCKLNKYGDRYSEIRLLRLVSNGRCGCVWKQKSLKYRICRCRKAKRVNRCVNNNTRRTDLFTFHPVRGARICRRRLKRSDKKIPCRGPYSKKSKCHRCGFIVHHYNSKPINCKCVTRRVRVEKLECCCQKSVTKRSCDTSRHMWVTVTISYKLRRYRCIPKRTVYTKLVRCGRKNPVYKFSRCQKGFRKIFKTIYYAVGCGCKSKTTVYKQRCACSSARKYVRGKCVGWFALDIWLAYKLKPTGKKIPGTNKPQKKCVKYVAHKKKRRCKCPKGFRKRICKRHNLEIFETVTYHLRGNSCERKRSVRNNRLPCSTKLRWVRTQVMPRACSSRNKYVQVIKKIYVYAKNCKCLYVTRKHTRICDCAKRHGRKKQVKCVGNNKVVTYTEWWVPKGYGCKKMSHKSVRLVRCKGAKIVRGNCSRKGFRIYYLYQRRAKKCQCIWVLVKRVTVPCRCRKTVVTKKCISNQVVTVTKKWLLVGKKLKAHCKLVKRTHKRKVPCKVGRYVKQSRCNFKGVKHIETTEISLNKCLCRKRVTRRSCRCHCRKIPDRRFCKNGRILVTVKTASKLRNCGCYKDSKVSRQAVRCKKSTKTRGPCRRGRNGDKYRKLTHIQWTVRNCKCRSVRKVTHQLCGCDKRRQVKNSCLAGYIKVTKITERRLVRGRCRRILVGKRRQRLSCGQVKVKKVCNKKSGQLNVFVTRPYVKHCRCFKKVTRHIRRCGCHHGSTLVSTAPCNKKSCRQRLLFKKQVLSGEKCIWKSYHRHRVCCCKGYRRTVKCDRKRGYVITTITKRVLKQWKCIKKVTKSSRKIKCKRHNTVSKRKLPGGVLKVTRCSVKRQDCKCVKSCKTVFLRYKCKKPVQRVLCKCSRRRCRKERYITVWRLSNGRCLKQTRRADKPIICKPKKMTRSCCSKPTKYGFYLVETTVSWYQKACRCHKRVQTRSVVCRCLKPHKKKICHRGHIVTFHYSYRLSRGRCVRDVKRQSQAVRCDTSWRLSHRTAGKPKYYKVYKRFVRSGCKCIRQTKRVLCYSDCRRCTLSYRCENGNQVATIRNCWRLVGCRCVSYRTVSRKRVSCPKSTIQRNCKRCNRTVIIKQYSVRKCKCIMKKQVKKSKCCCNKATTTRVCIRGAIRIRRITHTLRNGRCYSKTKDSFRRVNCTRRVLRAIQGRCKGGKQRYIVHYWVKIGCRCVRRVRSEFRKCACAHKAVDLFLVVDLYGKDRRGYKKRIVSFLKTVSTYFLHTSASVHITMVSYNWNVHVHKLKHLKNLPIKAFTNTRTDLCGALKEVNRRLHAKSRPGVEKIVVIITCGKHSKQHKTVALADKIKRKASVFVVGFRPIPKSGLYVKWLASKPIKMHYMELGIRRKYHFSATRLFERICKKACAKPVVKHSACHKHNCRRVYTRTTFYLDRRRKKCVRRSKSWWKLCCCIHRDSVEKKCYKNRLYRVVTSYRFKKHACHRSVRRYDISAQVHAACRPRSKLHRGPCRKDGWRKDTIVTRHVAQCRCKVGRRHQLIRCRCPKQHVVNTCVRGNHQQRCHYTYTLKPTGCTKNRRCRTSRVKCKTRKIVRGKCNRSSCKRSMGSIWYTVRNCKCKRHYKVWKETCCCKRQLQKYRYCDKRSQQHVEVHSWLEFHKRSCRRVSRKIYRPVRCPSPRTKKSKCIAKRNGFYRKWVECYWKKRNCVCIKYTKSRYKLCRCRRGYATKKCRSGSWVYIHHHWQKSGNKCIARSKITSRIRVTCSSKRHSVVGPCNIVKGNKKYARVVQTWKRRVGCRCKTVSNSFLKLCACQKPYKRHSCLRNNRLVVTEYRFFVSGNSCKLRKFTSYKLIRCPKARTKVSKCTGKTQAVIVVIHKPVKCKCVSKIYRRVVQCKSKCRDLLPTGICRKWAASNKIQLCDKYPYFAKRLCARTCHRCYGCPRTRLIYAKNFCLSKQRHFRRSFILAKRTSFDVCMSSCQKNSKCRAFDYDHSTRKCLLLRINRRGLLLRFPSLKLRKTRDCILFERICPTKCPFRRILKQYKCSCIKLGKQRVCYRTAAVATWKRNRSGSCQRRVHKLRVPCRKCEDRREFCKKSKCSRHLVRHLCNYTCGVCKRQPRGYHWRSRCSKSGWQKDIRVQVYYDRKLRLWRVSVRIKNLRCVRCQVGSYQLIGPCKNGQRKVTKIVARFVNGRCRISSHAKTYSCKNCGLVTRKLISKCYRHGKKWIRQVVTLYTIRVKGHCIVRRSLAVFSCSPKCPRDRSTVSQCKCGKRIRCFTYYVTYPGSNVCVPKRYTSSEKCASTQKCKDKIRPVDCLFVKKSNMCRSMRSLCARTCGYCK